ncbi:MAG TPA: hypothetical protein PLZ22_07675 [Thermotogota bacterium]|nr:hypothetical protein [Thermotogota bacterium]HPX98005.1 hypothetical protein [Thermotogota bacterium]
MKPQRGQLNPVVDLLDRRVIYESETNSPISDSSFLKERFVVR